MNKLVLGVMLIASMIVTSAYAHDGEGHRRHHGGMPYLTSAQLTQLAALNLSKEQWKCFFKGVRKAAFEQTRTQLGITGDNKPTKEEFAKFREAMQANFQTAFTQQLAVSPAPTSCPWKKPASN